MKVNRKSDDVVIAAVLDRSGSMQANSLIEEMRIGYNTMVKTLGAQFPEARLYLGIFDTEYDEIYTNRPFRLFTDLSKTLYFPRGGTALLDAVGYMLSSLEELNPSKVFLIIATDGYENSSRAWNKARLKAALDRAKEKGWLVSFLGADIDAFADGGWISSGAQWTYTTSGSVRGQTLNFISTDIVMAAAGYFGETDISDEVKDISISTPNTTNSIDDTINQRAAKKKVNAGS